MTYSAEHAIQFNITPTMLQNSHVSILRHVTVHSTHLQPLINDLLGQDQLVLPNSDFLLERFDERRTSHGLRFDDLIVQGRLDFLNRRQDRNTWKMY